MILIGAPLSVAIIINGSHVPYHNEKEEKSTFCGRSLCLAHDKCGESSELYGAKIPPGISQWTKQLKEHTTDKAWVFRNRGVSETKHKAES